MRLTRVRVVGQAVAVLAVLGAILFGVAGRIDWIGAWILTALYALFLACVLMSGLRHAPELFEERMRVARNVKRWDRIIMAIYTVLLLAMLVVAALDAGRFRRASVPLAVQIAAAVIIVAPGLVIWWCTAVNAYLSRFARIQADRGQQVVDRGPYLYVRHPMYGALIIAMICVPLILGSSFAVSVGALIGVLLVVRTSLEDQMLRTELTGYPEYAARVRYRLIPGIW